MNRVKSVLALAALIFGVLVAPGVAHAAPRAERFWGADRYATAAALSKAAYPDGAPVVVLASGALYADALAAGPVAAELGGPLLLIEPTRATAATLAELRRLKPERVIIAGETGAIGRNVERAVRAVIADTRRIGGIDRYETASELVAHGFDTAETVLLATGQNFPDALSGGAVAAAKDAPMLIASGLKDDSYARVIRSLKELKTKNVLVIGGEGVMPRWLVEDLDRRGYHVQRVGGADRYAVSLALAERVPIGSDSVIVASGENWPDALAATALADVRGAPLILSRPVCAAPSLGTAVGARGATTIALAGGPGAIRGLVASLTPCRSTANPASTWVLVNKRNPLRPPQHIPTDLRSVALPGAWPLRTEAARALERMNAAAVAAGVGRFGIASGYRSYAYQAQLYNGYVRSHGRAAADRFSARPGFSEHQTGLTADLMSCTAGCGSLGDFGRTAVGRWVAANGHRFGFIIRYRANREHITGYTPEPWHVRYVGVTLATDYNAGNFQSLEEYLGGRAAPRY